MNKTKFKQSNFELMRIISMFLIVVFHVIQHGRLIENFSYPYLEIIFNIIKSLTLVAVNSYIIMTGYFQSKLHFRIKKFLIILFQFFFYKTIIFLILGCLNIVPITKEFILSYYNPKELEYWFIFYYLILYLLSNFLNSIIRQLNLKMYTILIIILFFVFSIIPILSNGKIIENTGFTLQQFVFLYFIGGYIRIRKEKQKKNNNKVSYLSLFTYIIISIIIVIIYYTALNSNINNITIKGIINYSFYYSNPLVLIQTISYFIFFSTLKINNKTINNIARYILGVYLIHDNSLIRDLLYSFCNIIINSSSAITAITLTLFYSIIIFISSYLINYFFSILLTSLKKDNHLA